MSRIDLDKLEQKVYASRWDDGLLDLFVGVSVLGIGVLWMIPRMAGFGGILPVLLIPFWPLARKRITEPRAGFVEFTDERRGRERRGMRTMTVLGIGAFLLGVAAYFVAGVDGMMTKEWFRLAIPALPGVLIGLGAVAAGLMFQLDRFLSYGLLFTGLAAFLTFFGAEPGVYLAIGGGIVTVLGAVRLARFLRRYPIPKGAGS